MNNDIEKLLIEEFQQALDRVPGWVLSRVDGEMPAPSYRPDAIVEGRLRQTEVKFIVECKRAGFPRDIRNAIDQLQAYLYRSGNFGSGIVAVVAAESLSEGAKALLKEERMGYFDLDGNLFLPGDNFYLLIEKPPAEKKRKASGSIFRGKRAKALHAVWLCGDAWFSVGEIAERAGVSAGTASETLSALDEREWTAARGNGPSKERRIKNRSELLDVWSDIHRGNKPSMTRRYYVKGGTPQSIMQMIEDLSERNDWQYEITGEAAAQHYTPYLSTVTQVRCRLNILSRTDLREFLDVRPASQGWNLSVQYAEADRNLPFRKFADGIWFADELQTYLDLLQAGGRAKDLASHLREEILRA
ncbi:MAG: hypothetical protein AAGD15_21060 [Agrobacterium cavarae]|uniref:hypothetical protein n=1 Tax=Agrobacterium cavarae TaxID=2528239 RepID=UPI0031B16E15